MRPVVRKAIALQEIVGGIAGFLAVGSEMIRWRMAGPNLVLGGIVAAIFLLSLFAGLFLWQDLRAGYIASVVVQLLQLPKLVTAQFAFVLSFGFDVYITTVVLPGQHGIMVEVPFGERHLVFIGPPPVPALGLGVSVLSCVTVILLLRSLDRMKAARIERLAGRGEDVVIAEPVPVPHGSNRAYPEWSPPFWLKIVGILLLLLIFSCAGLIALTR